MLSKEGTGRKRTTAQDSARPIQSGSSGFFAYNPEQEPTKAYLRLRPGSKRGPEGGDDDDDNDSTLSFMGQPYLQVVDDQEISMTPPVDSNAYRTRNRAPERYRFTKILPETYSQEDFFANTTLPLIKDVLAGENALVFAYGVTNSGKTHSIMGSPGDPGILPRSLDVLFNSIHNNLGDSKLKPVMHSLVQAYENDEEESRAILTHMPLAEVSSQSTLAQTSDEWQMNDVPIARDETVVPIDERFEYSVWVSYAEIYTERIYDLLMPPDRHHKRKALALKYEFRSGNKYIAGLQEVRVHSVEEAYTILLQGQRHRAVYSTLMNHASSRSHSIFTIRVVRVPIIDNDYVIEDPSYAMVSKMTIVDLAGSERYRNTLNTGIRLKEAGNVNKSLMVLGQCMETLRLNQLKAAIGKRPAIVPFRHSKLTELFKSSFEGDGKAVMIVNVNAHDTGFDENSHVMKFAAVAKDVATWRRIHPKLDLQNAAASPRRRRAKALQNKQDTVSSSSSQQQHDDAPSVEDMDVSENLAEGDEDDDEDLEDPFVDNLIAQWADLRDKWIDAETRCATMEAEIRQQVAKELSDELRQMEELYMSSISRQNDETGQQIMHHLKHRGDSTATGDGNTISDAGNDQIAQRLYDRQEMLTLELERMKNRLQDNDITKQSLPIYLSQITDLERQRCLDQATIQQLMQEIKQQRQQRPSSPDPALSSQQQYEQASQTQPMDEDEPIDGEPMQTDLIVPQDATSTAPHTSNSTFTAATPPPTRFDQFLAMRKRLRRAVFKNDQYDDEANTIMTQIEQFQGVTFDLVKETNMGKLLKLISQHTFAHDPASLKLRSTQLLKQYLQLSIATLAPPRAPPSKRDSVVHLAVDVGKEDLISDMRDALDSLQDENSRLKHKLKSMEYNQRRLIQAFDKTSDTSSLVLTPTLPTTLGPMAATRRLSSSASPPPPPLPTDAHAYHMEHDDEDDSRAQEQDPMTLLGLSASTSDLASVPPAKRQRTRRV
ncbi:P-loop containing nucleoside triphosphate hydrolase protein [Gongronella butleri]|nr:P-loop containing nucleoside triphosphate hydrolase protein [Gongronella butleri]